MLVHISVFIELVSIVFYERAYIDGLLLLAIHIALYDFLFFQPIVVCFLLLTLVFLLLALVIRILQGGLHQLRIIFCRHSTKIYQRLQK